MKSMNKSKAARFQKMIRESLEFMPNQMRDYSEKQISNDSQILSAIDSGNYLDQRDFEREIIKSVYRKNDQKEYKKALSRC